MRLWTEPEAKGLAEAVVADVLEKLRFEAEEEADDALIKQLMNLISEYLLRPRALADAAMLDKLVAWVDPEIRLSKADIVKALADSRALYKGHFDLLCKRHSEFFFRFSQLAGRAEYREKICDELAQKLRGIAIDAILAPEAAGGLLVPPLGQRFAARKLYAKLDEDGYPQQFAEGYVVESGENILVVNDMITTGESIRRLVTIAQEKGIVTGVAVFASRGSMAASALNVIQTELEAPFCRLAHLSIESYDPKECQLCVRHIPLNYKSHDLHR